MSTPECRLYDHAERLGAGSELDFPNLTTWEGEYNCCGYAQVTAESGGEVSLSALVTDKGGSTHVLATGANSVVDLSALPYFISDQGGDYSALQATQSGQIEAPSLTSLSDVALTITQSGSVVDPNLATFVNVTITTDPTATFTVPANPAFSFPTGASTINTSAVVDQGSLQLGRNEVFTLSNYPGGGTGIISLTNYPSGTAVTGSSVQHTGERR